MIVARKTEMEVRAFEIGDIIEFCLKDGEKAQAMAVHYDPDGTVFCLVDCITREYPMNNRATNAGGYEDSQLRQKINGEILERFPAEIRAAMLPFSNGDFLRIPTEREIFGKNEYGEKEPETVTQWEPMKDRRNRIAFQGSGTGLWEWYWLQNAAEHSAARFARAISTGRCNAASASNARGVRPVFKIKNL